MCERGTMTLVALKTGELAEVDSCIAPLVAALNDGGFPTVGSCCGHGQWSGFVQLKDGRALFIRDIEKRKPPVNRTIADLEREAILRTIEDARGNKSEAARRLGITARTIHNKIKLWRRRGLEVRF